ncbi:MAG: AarF/ABC1/UbiB kinase family protein, partial [Deltaproteobacteria bacterium]|nr:AarF/ABC1/UbiB kinase family protein [Deltaproteobacteria bacterium]
PDLLPQELLVELEKLEDSVPPFSEEEAKQLIEKELDKPIANLFKEYVSTPIASASIAQVHKAVLTNGEIVAVKVQRPGIEQVIETDIEIMLHLATLMEEHIKGTDILNPIGIIKEFERSIRREIDFTIEASHIERFGRNFQEETTICVPKVYRSYTTRNIDALLESGNDPEIIASRGATLVLKQVFEHGFFHADPHPGNILVLDNNIICFLDFGMMGVLLPKYREYLGSIVVGIVNRDAERITKALIPFSSSNRIENIEGLEYQIFELIEQYSYIPLKSLNMGELLNKLIKLISSYKLKIAPDFYLLIKALVTIEGVGRKLDPDFDMVKHTEPFAKKLLRERLSPRKLTKDIYLSATELSLLLRDLPSEIREIIGQIKLGQVKMGFEHKGLEPMLEKHDQISNRIAFAIVLASLIIGSSLIVLSGIPPKWDGIPIIGIVGFLGAGIMGFWLLISILRHGKM